MISFREFQEKKSYIEVKLNIKDNQTEISRNVFAMSDHYKRAFSGLKIVVGVNNS